jgi:hypothetical protein
LFQDFLYTFKSTFVVIEKELRSQSVKYNDFIFVILNNLMPRLYHESDDFIQDQYCEIFEVLFITHGAVAVGYRQFNEVYFGKSLKSSMIVGDFDCIHGKVSEFLYRSIVQTRGFAMKKNTFNEIVDEKIGSKLKPRIDQKYQKTIREPLYKHRKL